MADGDDDRFRVRPGRPRSRGGLSHARALSFSRQVEIAVRKAGGYPGRSGRSAGSGSGRFNARGRGAKHYMRFKDQMEVAIGGPAGPRLVDDQ